MKKCPFCAEDIQDAAIVCKHCGRDLPPSPGGPTTAGGAGPLAMTATATMVRSTSVWSVLRRIVAVAGVMAVVAWIVSRFAPAPPPSHVPVGSPAPPFTLTVSVGLDGVQVTNDAGADWDGCRVTISGRYVGTIALMRPHNTARVPYEDFRDDRERPIPEHEGYARARHGVDIACSGPDYELHRGSFRFDR